MCHNSWSYGIPASYINPKLNQSKSICFFNKPYIQSLHCADTLIGINAQSLPFQCITKTAGTRFQQHFQPPKQTGVTLLAGSAACCLHNRLRMDRYPHVGGEEDIYCSGPVPYVLWVDCVLVLCVRAPVYDCVYDGLVSPRCRLLKWAELSRGQWSRGLTA